ncbi:MAG: hypothetical protein ACLFRO_05030 [Desulfobacterales bacterium]
MDMAMEIRELIANNQGAFLMLIGTISGVIIAQAGYLFSKWVDHRNDLAARRMEAVIDLKKEHLVKPVISFIDRDLKLMQGAYAKIFESDESGPRFEIDGAHIFELSSAQARVNSIGDRRLKEKFSDFSRVRITVGTIAAEKKTDEAHRELEKAIYLASEVLGLLFKNLECSGK